MRTPLVIDLVIVLMLDKMKTLFLLFISLTNISFILSSNATEEKNQTTQGKDKSETTTLGPELKESSTGSKIDDFMGEDSDSFDDPFANHEDFIGDNSTTSTTTLTTATTVTQTVTTTTIKTTDLTPSTSKSGSTTMSNRTTIKPPTTSKSPISTIPEHENDESPTVYEGDIGAIITVVSCSSGLLLVLTIVLVYDWKTQRRCCLWKKSKAVNDEWRYW